MDVNYFVDSAAELAQITPLEVFSIYLLDDAYRQVDVMIDTNREFPEDFLQNTARDAFRNASKDKQCWVALNSLQHVGTLSKCIKERAEFLLQKKIQSDLGKVAYVKPFPGLCENVEAYAGDICIQSEEDITETTARAILTKHMGGYMERLKEDAQLVQKALAWYQKSGKATFEALQSTHRMTAAPQDLHINTGIAVIKERIREQNKKTARKAIKKVTKLFSKFSLEENLQMFVSGQEVVLTPPNSNIKFVVRPLGEPGWLEDRTIAGRSHTPYDLSVLTLDNVFIAKLCVFFKDTPVLDQLLALTMFVQAGDELQILEKANFYAMNRDDKAESALLAQYPSLAEKFPKKSLDPVDGILRDAQQAGRTLAIGGHLRKEQDHWAPFQQRIEQWVLTYLNPVFEEMLPKKTFQLQLA